MRTQPECPECEKLAAVSEESNKIGDFLEWLSSEGIGLAQWQKLDEFRDEMLMPCRKPYNELLADYFDIDLDKVERERRALLDWLREVQSD